MRQILVATAAIALGACGDRPQGNSANADGSSADNPEAAASLEPGQWEMTVATVRAKAYPMTVGGAQYEPGEVHSPPPRTSTFCLTPDETRRPLARLIYGGATSNCSHDSLTMQSGQVRGAVQCTQSHERSRYNINGRYSATTYEVLTQVETRHTRPVGSWDEALETPSIWPMDHEYRLTGRRIGECTDEPGGANEQGAAPSG